MIKLDKNKLPSPTEYYKDQFKSTEFNKKNEWIKVNCIFHEEKTPSLHLNTKFGGFKCFGCGIKGGDIIEFHKKRYNLTFKQCIKELTKK